MRLGVLAVLGEASRADFGFLRDSLALTDGNLSRHIAVLEEAGVVKVRKGFEGGGARGRDDGTARAHRAGGRGCAAVSTIEISGASKHFGHVHAVNDLSFDVDAGRVTGFLGPNGAGKSTTLRILLGLIRADGGSATFAGRRYDELQHPSAQVGAVLENASFHPGRSGRNHLRVLAAAGRHPEARVDEVLGLVGLSDAADRRVKGYSMGMRQRLAIAAALLGDPEVLILDEPTNGLDPPGIRWVRDLLRSQAGRGRAVLVSSHLLSEVAQSVDDVVVISHGVLKASGPLEQVLGSPEGPVTRVRSVDPDRLAAALTERGAALEAAGDGVLLVRGGPELVGDVAAEHRIALRELIPVSRSLEEAFFELTGEEG